MGFVDDNVNTETFMPLNFFNIYELINKLPIEQLQIILRRDMQHE